ncbi:MAG: hypothetical protein WDZ31_06955 [Phycisphaeraceae bacterium]
MLIDSRDLKTLGAAAAVLVVFGVGLWLPAELERRDLRERIGQTEQALAGELADVQLLDPLREQVARLHVAVDEAPHYVPPREDLDHLLRRLI